MAVLEQSPWYREIEKKGFIRAISLGLELKFGEEGQIEDICFHLID